MNNDIKLSWFKDNKKINKVYKISKKYRKKIENYNILLFKAKKMGVLDEYFLEHLNFKIGICKVQVSRLISYWRFHKHYSKWWNENYAYSLDVYIDEGAIKLDGYKNPEINKLNQHYINTLPTYIKPKNLERLFNGKDKIPKY